MQRMNRCQLARRAWKYCSRYRTNIVLATLETREQGVLEDLGKPGSIGLGVACGWSRNHAVQAS